ncbi:uncharacterized protein METZ01_LOCUS187655, partial [marine metagenome]
VVTFKQFITPGQRRTAQIHAGLATGTGKRIDFQRCTSQTDRVQNTRPVRYNHG